VTSTVRLNAFRKYFARRNWGEIIRNDRPDFNFHALPIFDGKAELWCVTFRPNPDDSSNPYNWWQPLKPFQIKDTRLEKADIYKAMEENYLHGFKFYLRVPNTIESLREYRNALATADVIVTGKGSVDPEDPNWCRIWFFHPEGFVHPYSARSYLAVKPQEVIPGQTESADRWLACEANMRPVTVVAMEPSGQRGISLLCVLEDG